MWFERHKRTKFSAVAPPRVAPTTFFFRGVVSLTKLEISRRMVSLTGMVLSEGSLGGSLALSFSCPGFPAPTGQAQEYRSFLPRSSMLEWLTFARTRPVLETLPPPFYHQPRLLFMGKIRLRDYIDVAVNWPTFSSAGRCSTLIRLPSKEGRGAEEKSSNSGNRGSERCGVNPFR